MRDWDGPMRFPEILRERNPAALVPIRGARKEMSIRFALEVTSVMIDEGMVPGYRRMVVLVDVASRDTGEWIPLRFEERFPDRGCAEEENIIRTILGKMLMHEVDEALLVQGERLFDPHRGGR